jgi:8-oxo-dGTP pyrophosphatase MutT (NUDIX family)
MGFQQHFYQRLKALSARTPLKFPEEEIPENYKPAAVLLGFWPNDEGGVELVLTKRTTNLSSHQGQVSFPGGRVDHGETYEQAALRETEEELAINPELVNIMGRLDDAWSRYGHHVVPYVGWLEQKPDMTPNPNEVAEILIANMETVMHPDAEREHEVVFPVGDKQTHVLTGFEWDGGYVWGLSADLLLELILWIKEEPSDRGQYRLNRMREFGM